MASERDRQAAKEFRKFLQAEAAAELEKQDRAEYMKYVAALQKENSNVGNALRLEPLSFEEWRAFAPKDVDDPVVRGALTTANALRKPAFDAEREAVLNGQHDPGWALPESALGLRMTFEQAKKFNADCGKLFAGHTPNFDRSTSQVLIDYLSAQGVFIANEDVWKAAFERCLILGLIHERQPEPEIIQEPEPVAAPVDDGSMSGIDPETGLTRIYTKREIARMSSDFYRRCFPIEHDLARFIDPDPFRRRR